MGEHQTPTQNERLSTPNAPKHHRAPRPDHVELSSPAYLFKTIPNTQEKVAEDYADLKSLVTSSEPDSRPPFTYFGPPIGYSAKLIKHHTLLGVTTTSVFGSLTAPRPRLIIPCDDHVCVICRVSPPHQSIHGPSGRSAECTSLQAGEAMSSGSATPPPPTPNARDYIRPRSDSARV